ncbi:MAG: YceI family protein [Bacteroidales bacterium]
MKNKSMNKPENAGKLSLSNNPGSNTSGHRKSNFLLKSINFLIILLIAGGVYVSAQDGARLVSEKSHIRFFSSTPAEDIEAHNYSATSTLDKTSGNVAFSVPMQGFEFDKRLMQRHFNQDGYLDTQQYPTARLVGKITNLEDIDFSQNGSYDAVIEGELTIKGITNDIKEKGTITVNGSRVTAESVFQVTLADYGIVFTSGRPASNIAGTIEVTVNAEYQPQ